MFVRRCVAFMLAVGLGLSVSVQPAGADGPMGTAVIKGKVILDGAVTIKTKAIKMGGVPACAALHKKPVPDQGTLFYKKQDNAVPYVFVYAKNVKDKYDPPADPIVIDQKNCMYEPHVFGMIAGQGMDIKNSDPTNHNIHSLPKRNAQFNFGQPQQNMVKQLRKDSNPRTFTRKEVMVKIKCDVHSWMSSYCGVLNHPFFDVTKSHTTDGGNKAARGTFEIKGLPAGSYEIEAVHEKLGKVSQTVSVADGETKEITFKIGGKASARASFRTVELASADRQDGRDDGFTEQTPEEVVMVPHEDAAE